jgi:hypothetical protein
MTDFRALCAELLEALDEWTEYESPVTVDDAVDLAKVRSLADARAALAQPEPPSLKEQALMALEDGDIGPGASLTPVEVCIIRRALEQLDD